MVAMRAYMGEALTRAFFSRKLIMTLSRIIAFVDIFDMNINQKWENQIELWA